ncbi:MAG: YihY/virulence factor BrkB family protein [Actinomycetota bacterium]|nr:YihY/virulence factor BrkB family protein [Actinomycetota bacterium]MDA8209492.1 YihY/virulence factor BrkB family protein [Actinomycetota bacterium]
MRPTELAGRALAAFDGFQARHKALAFAVAVAKKFGEDRAGSMAALIAYYGFFALFPLLLILVTVLGFVLQGHPALQASILATAKRDFPSFADYLKVGSITGSGLALGTGVIAALWAGLGVAGAAQQAMNTIWEVPREGQPDMWKSRLRSLSLLGTLGTTLVLSTAASALNGIGGTFAPLFTLAGTLAPLILNFALYLFAFRLLTAEPLSWKDIFPGAALGAVAWTLLQWLGGYYTRHVVAHASHVYGTFAVVIGLLAWLHLGAQVTLYAAETNTVLRRHMWPRRLRGEEAAAGTPGPRAQAIGEG